ncbi:MAG: HPr family phosphocarrier protein [Anaerolineae bacterium]|nr:HPr family phosphocarrier protein [Anaerolineae bacterium]
MPDLKIIVDHDAGLHARPLAQFVKVVKSYGASVQVRNLTSGKGPVNGASPVNLLLLSVKKGNEIEITAEGEQASEVLTALKTLIESNFGEG